MQEDKLFDENIFTIVQELPYVFKHEGKTRFSFRPDLSFFLNDIYLGHSELKRNWNNQTAGENGRHKVMKDYLSATQEYLVIAEKTIFHKSFVKTSCIYSKKQFILLLPIYQIRL